MAGIKRLILLAFAATITTVAVAQENSIAAAEWQRNLELGHQHESAWSLYLALKAAAGGGHAPASLEQLPDWSGLWRYTRNGAAAPPSGSLFAPGPQGTQPELTPAAVAMAEDGARRTAEGIMYDDNLSTCGPPGFPRWLTIPFLREFIVRPEQTWLTSETVNNVRRIYTDDRDHPPEMERYPLYYGDSIGFWDDQKLVIHTNQLMAREMGRNTLTQSEQMETVEVWEQVDDRTIQTAVWLYDPTILQEPWHVRGQYTREPNADKSLRMRFWHCGENQNNEVFQTEEGGTEYSDFTFTSEDDR